MSRSLLRIGGSGVGTWPFSCRPKMRRRSFMEFPKALLTAVKNEKEDFGEFRSTQCAPRSRLRKHTPKWTRVNRFALNYVIAGLTTRWNTPRSTPSESGQEGENLFMNQCQTPSGVPRKSLQYPVRNEKEEFRKFH